MSPSGAMTAGSDLRSKLPKTRYIECMEAFRQEPLPPASVPVSGETAPVCLRDFATLTARVVNGTFGGGSTILGVFQRELVERKAWLSAEQYGLCFAVARITPGTSILAFCAAVGWSFDRWRGALLGMAAAVLPCAAIALGMLLAYEELKGLAWFATALRGAMAAAIGVMLAAGWSIMQPYCRTRNWPRHVALLLASLSLMLVAGLSPLPILGMAALVGFLLPESSGDRGEA